MTDPIDEVDDVIVTGQRKPLGMLKPFPFQMVDLNTNQPILRREDIQPGMQVADQCASEDGEREWNSDAAAAKAFRDIKTKSKALDDTFDLYTREWGAALYRNSAGQFYLGPILPGPVMGGTVAIDFDSGGPKSELIGYVHSHPSSGGVSPPDWDLLDHIDTYWSSYPSEQLRFYTIQPSYPDGSNAPVWKLHYYGQDQRGSTAYGPEVNPFGQACPID